MGLPAMALCFHQWCRHLYHVLSYLYEIACTARTIMEFIVYTIAGLLLYGISDYILNTIEIRLQKRLPNRSLIFFVIISVLAVSSFSVINMIYRENNQNTVPDETSIKSDTGVPSQLQVHNPKDIYPQNKPAPASAR